MKPVIRLEEYLTRDYVDRAAKLKDLDGRWDPHINQLDLVCCWIIIAGLVLWCIYAW